jgi:methionine-rich copper-binding protein CopC
MRISRSGVIRMRLVTLLSVLALVFASGTASTHAQLEDSDPPAGEVLPTAPHQVTLTFGEPVEVAAGSVQVFDDHFNRVDDDQVEPTDPQRNQIQVGLNDGLAPGTYTVSWKVSSADTTRPPAPSDSRSARRSRSAVRFPAWAATTRPERSWDCCAVWGTAVWSSVPACCWWCWRCGPPVSAIGARGV